MIWLEAYLVAILLALFVSASITDLKKGVVSNKSILVALGAGIMGVIPYYAFFATDCLVSYSVNIGISLTISLILYAMGIWGAGDSKLYFTTIIVFPARIYCMGNRSLASCFLMVAIIFIVAFAYVLVETIIVGIKQRDLFKLQIERINWISYIKGFLFYFFLLSLVNTVFYILFPDNLLADSILMTAIQFIVILIGMKLIERASWLHTIILGVVWGITLVLHFSSLNFSNFSIFPYIIILVLVLFRTVADKYNYKCILVEDLKPGMILSMGSILGFVGSRVQGLPTISTEDLKSRLTKDEVESINRWSKTKIGNESIVIVRKIPFALFIGIGTVIFIVLEVALR